jgi:hypothetical protein
MPSSSEQHPSTLILSGVYSMNLDSNYIGRILSNQKWQSWQITTNWISNLVNPLITEQDSRWFTRYDRDRPIDDISGLSGVGLK